MSLWISINFHQTELFCVIYSEKVVFLIAQMYTLNASLKSTGLSKSAYMDFTLQIKFGLA